MTINGSNSGNEMPSGSGEMPGGSMTDITDKVNGTIAAGGAEMPSGSMIDGTGNFSDQSPGGGEEMPAGSMTGSSGMFGSLVSSGRGDMPLGNMNGMTTGQYAQQNQSQVFELPGKWKLQLICLEN